MTIVSSRVFAENPIHYLNLSITEEIAIKRGKNVFRIIHEEPKFENPSPSGDPYWADPRNVAELERRLKERREGKEKLTELTPEMQKEWFNNV